MARIISLEKVLALYVTSNCNFRCKTCIREYGKERNLDLSLLKRVLPDAVPMGYLHAGLTGGEPCLHPQFERIVETVVDNGMTFNFTSNGSMPDKYEFMLDRFRKNLLVANFSLDGATAKTNDEIRGPGSFKKVLESIRYFVGSGVETIAVVTLTKLNVGEVEDIIRLCIDLDMKQVSISAAIANAINKDMVLSDEEKSACMRELNSLSSKYREIAIFPGTPLRTGNGVDNCVCMFLLNSPLINPKGELAFCCNTVREGAVLGSLERHGFAELYKKALDISSYLRQIRIDRISTGTKEEGFNSCEFCNKYLSEYISD